MTRRQGKVQRGFALPLVVISVSGLILLLVAMMGRSQTERKTSGHFRQAYQAELAARSALAEVRARLGALTLEDDYLIVKKDVNLGFSGEIRPRPFSYLAKPFIDDEGESQFRFEPLFSTSVPTLSDDLAGFREKGGRDESADFSEIPLSTNESSLTVMNVAAWQHPPVVEWKTISEANPEATAEGAPVARYCYWIEDLEGRLDALRIGQVDETGLHKRSSSDSPVAGMLIEREVSRDYPEPAPQLAPIALHSLFDGENKDQSVDGLDKEILRLRERLGDSDEDFLGLLSSEDIHSLREGRHDTSRSPRRSQEPVSPAGDDRRFLNDEVADLMERTLTLANHPYLEQALIPHLPEIEPGMRGEPRINLNALLSGDDFIQQFSDHVSAALPTFAERRRGGFKEDYLKTLAANARDYADEDSVPSFEEGFYRGLEAMPVVSEYAITYSWDGSEGGRVRLSARPVFELWNMSNQTISGTIRLSFESDLGVTIGAVPDFGLGDAEILSDSSASSHELVQEAGLWWFPEMNVSMGPNEFLLLSPGAVRFTVNAGSAAEPPFRFESRRDGRGAGYHLKWQGTLIDRAKSGIEINAFSLHQRRRLLSKASIPAHSSRRSGGFINNMGDPRMSFYLEGIQAANAYPRNYSPWRRTVRRSIFEGEGGSGLIHARVFPSEWPDGGHETNFGTSDYNRSNEKILPDDSSFEAGRPQAEEDKALTYLSQRGQFFSETELGHIYDPVQWDSRAGTRLQSRWLDIDMEAVPSAFYGGGNSLRVGRHEHSRFASQDVRASLLLDLFHAGLARSKEPMEREGQLVAREGHLNVNTASVDALRAVLAGNLVKDPAIGKGRVGDIDLQEKRPRVMPAELGAPDGGGVEAKAADLVAEAIVRNRPYASLSEVVEIETAAGDKLFGNKDHYEDGEGIQWSDRAAEELFGRLYNSGTVRSRNFRVHVIGQSLSPTGRVLATHRRVAHVFADPGERRMDGSINEEKTKMRVLHEWTR